MLRLSKLADYSVVILATMARQPKDLMTSSHLSDLTTLPAPTVAKLLKKMTKSGLLHATRGAAGGYRLSRSPEKIDVASIIEVVDGPIKIVGCVEPERENCGHEAACAVYGRWEPINHAVKFAFSSVMLSHLIDAENKAFVTSIPSSCASDCGSTPCAKF